MELTLHLKQKFLYLCDNILLCSFIQNGLQPIHHAAQEGHVDVVIMLIEEFHQKPDALTNVCLS